METITEGIGARPAHVDPALFLDIDFYALPGTEAGLQKAWYRLKSLPPAFYTARNGGHWIITDSGLLEALFVDTEHLSNAKKGIPHSGGAPMLPSEADPPEHAAYRSLIQPMFTPRHIDGLEDRFRIHARSLIVGFVRDGECEFISAFGRKLPITVFLELMGLPVSDMDRLVVHSEQLSRGGDPAARVAAWNAVQDYLDRWLDHRMDHPGDDLISNILRGLVRERPITRDEARGVCTNLLLGGLDTVASMMGCVAHCLAVHRELRAELAAQPLKISGCVVELIRRFAIVGQGRIVKRDLQIGSALLKAEDRVLLPTMLYNLDPERFADPWSVKLDRGMSPHLSFGKGIHRCPGSYITRTEIRVFLEEWLKAIPDFGMRQGTQAVFKSGQVSAVMELHLSWPRT